MTRLVGGPLVRLIEVMKLYRAGMKLTAPQVSQALDFPPEGVRRNIHELHDAGFLYIFSWEKGKAGPYAKVFAWCDVFGTPDAPHPFPDRAGAQ